MIWFIIKWALFTFGIWFLNGLRKVCKNPRFKIMDFQSFDYEDSRYNNVKAQRVQLKRQEYLPPFLVLEEIYVKKDYERQWTRIPDGKVISIEASDYLINQIHRNEIEKRHLDIVSTPRDEL